MATQSTLRFIGLDIGGSFLKAAIVNPAGKVEERHHEPIAKESLESLLEQLERTARGLAGEAGARAIGAGIPGIVEQETARVRNAPNVPVLNGFALADELRRRTGLDCFLENDANAAALAEAWRGAGRDSTDQLFVSLGTGIGGGLILGGRIWAGKSGYAGEIGHVQVDPRGSLCGCGAVGCLETVAGIGGFVRLAAQALESRESSLRGQSLDPEVIVKAARAGDAVALDVVQDVARALGVGIGAALNLLNLDRVVLGGGVAGAGDFLLERVVAEVRARCFPQVFADVSFRLAELGADAGVVGAARVAMVGLAA